MIGRIFLFNINRKALRLRRDLNIPLHRRCLAEGTFPVLPPVLSPVHSELPVSVAAGEQQGHLPAEQQQVPPPVLPEFR